MFIIDKNFETEILRYLDTNIETGPWLAGSMARKLYQGEDTGLSDWDIWVKDKEQELEVTSKLANLLGCVVSFQSNNADTYTHAPHGKEDNHKIQLIKCKYFDTPEAIIDNFDFTVCQIATDGKNFIFGENTKHDLEHKILRHTAREKPDTEGIIGRMIKYIVYGYRPDKQLLQFINDEQNINWTKFPNDYNSI